jgi:FtsH-binding integral membrane protein
VNEPRKRFARELMAADPPSSDARERYEKEVRAMLEMTLSPRKRGVYLVAALLLLLPAAFLVLTPLEPPPEGKPDFLHFVVAYFLLSAVALLAVAVLFFRGFWTGVINRRASRRWATGIGVAYVGLVGWLFMLMAHYLPEMLQDDVRIFGLVLMLYAAVAWVRHGIAQAESRTAEKLLEMELRLAEIGEAMQTRTSPTGSAAPPTP